MVTLTTCDFSDVSVSDILNEVQVSLDDINSTYHPSTQSGPTSQPQQPIHPVRCCMIPWCYAEISHRSPDKEAAIRSIVVKLNTWFQLMM